MYIFICVSSSCSATILPPNRPYVMITHRHKQLIQCDMFDPRPTPAHLSLSHFRPVYVNTHELYFTQFNSPAYCNVCRKLLKGLVRQGLVCCKCRIVCHEPCKDRMTFTCKTTHAEHLPDTKVWIVAVGSVISRNMHVAALHAHAS